MCDSEKSNLRTNLGDAHFAFCAFASPIQELQYCNPRMWEAHVRQRDQDTYYKKSNLTISVHMMYFSIDFLFYFSLFVASCLLDFCSIWSKPTAPSFITALDESSREEYAAGTQKMVGSVTSNEGIFRQYPNSAW